MLIHLNCNRTNVLTKLLDVLLFSQSFDLLTLQDAAKKLTRIKKIAFMAQVTQDDFDGSTCKAETYLGWSRQAVGLGLKELQTGIVCLDNYAARGRKKTEENPPNLEEDIWSLVDSQSLADPNFQSTFYYARISARSVREELIEQKGYQDYELPTRQTIGDILN